MGTHVNNWFRNFIVVCWLGTDISKEVGPKITLCKDLIIPTARAQVGRSKLPIRTTYVSPNELTRAEVTNPIHKVPDPSVALSPWQTEHRIHSDASHHPRRARYFTIASALRELMYSQAQDHLDALSPFRWLNVWKD